MDSDIIINKNTQRSIDRLLLSRAQSIGFIGEPGVGKTEVASSYASKVLGIKRINLDNYPYYMLVPSNSMSISIESVREIQNFLTLKTTGHNKSIKRVVVVEHADYLTKEAQNAFLKTLEEPPVDTVIILTANNVNRLLPTIRSRLSFITVLKPHTSDCDNYFHAKGYAGARYSQAKSLSNGLPGLLTNLLENENDHPLIESVNMAKSILQKTKYNRLIDINSIAESKEKVVYFLQALIRISEVSVNQAAIKHDQVATMKWKNILKAAINAESNLYANVQTKLVLLDLMLSI